MGVVFVLNSRHLPIKSHKDAEYVLREAMRQKYNLIFELDNGFIAQFTYFGNGFEFLNCRKDTPVLQRMSIRLDFDSSVKELYRLRKYFNRSRGY